jgi:hypothetical protein
VGSGSTCNDPKLSGYGERHGGEREGNSCPLGPKVGKFKSFSEKSFCVSTELVPESVNDFTMPGRFDEWALTATEGQLPEDLPYFPESSLRRVDS